MLVVGGGPGGSTAALHLARLGARVALIDRDVFPRDKLCGGFVSAESRTVLSMVGLDGGPQAGPHALIDTFALSTPGGRQVETPLPGGALAWGVSRRVLDAWLLEAAASAGADVITGMEAISLVFDGEFPVGIRARASAHGVAARDIEVRARHIVAADGRSSRIARLLDEPSARARPHRRYGFQALFEAPRVACRSVEIHFFRGGYIGLQPVGGGLANACGILDRRTAGSVPRSLDALMEEILLRSDGARERMPGARRVSDWHAVGGLSFGPRAPSRQGVLFVGDAAGTIEPFTGEGISMALASGMIASRCLAGALQRAEGCTDPAASYSRAWRRAFLARLRLSRVLARLASKPSLLEGATALMSRRPRLAALLVGATRAPMDALG